MYKLKISLYISAFLLLLSSCTMEEIDGEAVRYWLDCKTPLVSANGVAENKSIQLESNLAWKATKGSSWIGLSASSGTNSGSIKCSLQANPSGDQSRKDSVVFVALKSQNPLLDKDRRCVVNFVQAAGTKTLTPSPSRLSFGPNGGHQKIAFNYNYSSDWEVSELPNWLTAVTTKGTQKDSLELVAMPATTEGIRSATFKVTAGSLNTTVSAFQSALSLTIWPKGFSVKANASTYAMEITLNANDATWKLTGLPSWVTASAVEGVGSAKVQLTVANNLDVERTCTIKVTSGEISNTINLTQAAFTFSVIPLQLTTRAKGETKSITLASNVTAVPWSIEELPTWCTVSSSSGIGATDVSVTTSMNIGAARTGSFKVKAGNKTIEVSVSQGEPTMTVTPTSFTLPATESTQEINIDLDVSGAPWTLTGLPSWVKASSVEGTGSAMVQLIIPENTSEKREATLTITSGQLIRTVTLVQEAPYLQVNATSFTLGSTGGSKTVSIRSNVKWTIRTADTWFTFSKLSGKGDLEVQMTVGDHPSATDRKGSFKVTTSGGQEIECNVSQNARYLTIEKDKLSFIGDGGTASVVITTDGIVNVTSSQTWLTVTLEGKTLTLTAPKNETDAVRTAVVTLSLQGIEGTVVRTIQITQYKTGVSKEDYGEDTDLDNSSEGDVTKDGYGEDTNLD